MSVINSTNLSEVGLGVRLDVVKNNFFLVFHSRAEKRSTPLDKPRRVALPEKRTHILSALVEIAAVIDVEY